MRKTKRSGAAMRVRPRGEHLAPAPSVKRAQPDEMKIDDYELWLQRLKGFGQKEVEIERFSATWQDLFNLAHGLSVSRQRSVCLPSTASSIPTLSFTESIRYVEITCTSTLSIITSYLLVCY